ncbi:MAG: type II toxin-antitoxin system VapC family toxin [Candidatus Omnitrophota bacterium]
MNLVDSSGWLEFFTDGPLAQKYFSYLEKIEEIVVPALIIYEVYKKIKRERSEEDALLAVAHMGKARVVVLDDSLALTAADVSLRYNLAMADAIIYATAQQEKAKLITSDKHFLGLHNVVILR